ncbi:MAG: PqqD family protein [Ruminococcaceae bacterium]|nr:PqqD family protein [Oscillospiraceae bacterium]
MKIKSGYILRSVAGNNIVIPVGEESIKFKGVMTLSGSGAYLWNILCQKDATEQELAAALCEKYDVDEAVALADVKAFVKAICEKGLFE